MCTYSELIGDVWSNQEGPRVQFVDRSIAAIELRVLVEYFRIEGGTHHIDVFDVAAVFGG